MLEKIRALDAERGREIALKSLHAALADDLCRLKREFRFFADVRHAHLVRLYNLLAYDFCCFIMMERWNGSPLLSGIRALSRVHPVMARLAPDQEMAMTGRLRDGDTDTARRALGDLLAALSRQAPVAAFPLPKEQTIVGSSIVGSPPASSDPLVGTILGRYLLVRRLGEGGMGAVYEAVHQDLGRRAAIKTLHAHCAESAPARLRFLREAQAASRIHHPNVADVYDVGIDESQLYLVMELLEGETLARVIAREGPLSVQRTADILLPVVAAVAAAHDLGVIHRDLKPENIFLSAGRNTLSPKVLDFGISKLILGEQGPVLTDTGAFLGTPYYVSPEQARGAKSIDVRSDQYSIGVILYECVTARRPVEEPSLYAMIQRIVHGDFAAPRQLNPSLPSALEAVILKAMARIPTGRFATTRELGNALLEFASAGVRASYADELSSGPSSGHTPHGFDAPNQDLGKSTTLGESAVQRDAPRTGRSALPRAYWVAAIAVVVVALCTSSPERRAGSDAGASAANVVLAAPIRSPVPAIVVDPEPLVYRRLVSERAGASAWVDGGQAPLSLEGPRHAPLTIELGGDPSWAERRMLQGR